MSSSLPSMSQIARELGLSRCTVSTIINHRAREKCISEETEKRVITYLHERGYVPWRQPLDLRVGTLPSVGILQAGRLYGRLIEAFHRFTDHLPRSRHMPVEVIKVARTDLLEGVRELLSRRVRQLVWIHTSPSNYEMSDHRILNYLRNFETVVIYNFYFGLADEEERTLPENCYRIGVDRRAAAASMARFLARLGHRGVLFTSTLSTTPDTLDVYSFFRKAGIRIHFGIELEQSWGPAAKIGQAYAEAVRRAMREGATAAIFEDDEEAAYAMADLRRSGVRIPEDLTVIGSDDLPVASLAAVPITTFAVPVDKMYACAEKILTRPPRQRRHCFNLEIVERDSHGPAPRIARSGSHRVRTKPSAHTS